jgi:cation:H+ antiporter
MSLPLALLLVVAGLAILAAGGELLVRGAVAVARELRMSPAVIGLTIVAMATSLPELAVSVLAALRGSPDVAVGNVVGSNIFNVAAILGLSAILFPPLLFRSRMLRFDVFIMMLAAVLALVVSRDGLVGRPEGIVFLALLAAFLFYRGRQARQLDADPDEAAGELTETVQTIGADVGTLGVAASVGFIVVGAAMLTGGAEVLVRGAVRLAELAGVSERVIAVTLVSAGTGLPELATSIIAGMRKHAGVAVGNVIGSNIFNVFGILGTVAVVRPVAVADQLATHDMVWMIGISVIAVYAVALPRRRISRFEGALALAAYVVYVMTLL